MKKKINVALILIVLTVWGFVASKTLNQYFFLDKKTNHNIKHNSSLKINQINKDTFSICHIDRDPFLNKENRVITASFTQNTYFKSTVIKRKLKPVITKHIEILNWPLITYHGYINSKDQNNELLILVNIDKKLYKLKLNEQSEGITLKKIFKDSIELDFNREKRIFRLN